MTSVISSPALRLVRLPGEFGPMLRCYGELSVATAEALQRELALLLPLGHPVLILNLSGCSSVDADGIMSTLHAYKALRWKGARLAIVTGTGRIPRLLLFMGITRIIPIYQNEESAVRALRNGGPEELAPETWETAREETLGRWRAIRELFEEEPADGILRELTSMTSLCERSEAIYEEQPGPAPVRCQYCPLYYELGADAKDIGCRSVLDPILQAVRAGDKDAARAQMEEMIRLLEEMPLPPEVGEPGGAAISRREGDGRDTAPVFPPGPINR